MGLSQDEAVARLLPAGAIYFSMDEADVQRILAFEPTMIGSDGLPHDAFPHPRLWATFPRVLGHYSRDAGPVPARAGGAQDDRTHGADLRPARTAASSIRCIMPTSPCSIRHGDEGRYVQSDRSRQRNGIDTVIVNGTVVWRDGKSTGARPGRVLSRAAA